MDRKATTGAGSGSQQKEEVVSITPTINHTIIRALGKEAQGLGLYDLCSTTALSTNVVRNHLFTLIVAGIVHFERGSLYQLTDAGKRLLEDILS